MVLTDGGDVPSVYVAGWHLQQSRAKQTFMSHYTEGGVVVLCRPSPRLDLGRWSNSAKKRPCSMVAAQWFSVRWCSCACVACIDMIRRRRVHSRLYYCVHGMAGLSGSKTHGYELPPSGVLLCIHSESQAWCVMGGTWCFCSSLFPKRRGATQIRTAPPHLRRGRARTQKSLRKETSNLQPSP